MPPPNDLQNIPDEPSSSSAAPSGEQTFISHLIELRSRLLRAIACVGAVLLCMLVPCCVLMLVLAPVLALGLSRCSKAG